MKLNARHISKAIGTTLRGQETFAISCMAILGIDYDLQLESRILDSVSSARIPAPHREPQAQLRLGYAWLHSSSEDVTPR